MVWWVVGAPPLALMGQQSEEWIQGKALTAMVWGVGVGLGLGTSSPYFEVDNRKKKVLGPFEAVGGRHDPLKLLKIGYSYRVTSSPKIASKSQNVALYVTKATGQWGRGWGGVSPCAICIQGLECNYKSVVIATRGGGLGPHRQFNS